MTSLNSTPDEPFDLFDRESLRYSAAEFTHGEIDAKHDTDRDPVAQTVSENEWFRLRPGADYIWPVAMYARVSEKGDELYLVPGPFRRLFDESVLNPCGCGWSSIVLVHRSSGR